MTVGQPVANCVSEYEFFSRSTIGRKSVELEIFT
ncbi:unnamed protein product [Acanthoscelides obtectus]|uniref:Uncharacterized protein n=1 Tax=Acanthoscelides obtectus TaxID=200917 RepID=A0A9P0K326_ACAOB|nr:unnamed protein product [Acanthoscelides obtectus]CAK1632048.1 hypothetical protein AOBTE_LOCUS7327 [Acanthoscelides obtectus]